MDNKIEDNGICQDCLRQPHVDPVLKMCATCIVDAEDLQADMDLAFIMQSI